MGGVEALVQQLYQVEGKAEIVHGRLVRMSAAGGLHGYAAGAIHASLLEYARRTRRGIALPCWTPAAHAITLNTSRGSP